jgi:hypothetical protein
MMYVDQYIIVVLGCVQQNAEEMVSETVNVVQQRLWAVGHEQNGFAVACTSVVWRRYLQTCAQPT